MANRNLFKTGVATTVKPANTLNEAGGRAYKLDDETALAQYVVTSCFNRTFYATGEEQVDKVASLAANCRTEFVAKAAVYGHETAKMKDVPAYLLAVLAARMKSADGAVAQEAVQAFQRAFPRVVTNIKMLANFVQIVRSGAVGRRSFGTVAKRAIRKWLESKTGNQLFVGSVGVTPALGDIIRMVHPRPESPEKTALYAYLIDKAYDPEVLPPKVRDFEAFKQWRRVCGHKQNEDGRTSTTDAMPIPDVPFQLLTALDLTTDEWAQVFRNMPWNALRMNLNTLARHGVFNVPGMTEYVTRKLSDPDEVRKNSVFPYQLLTAYLNTTDVPQPVRNALQDALEVATENVPSFGCGVAVCIDTSGSMGSPITGHREGSTSKVTCVQVAALAGATIARRNKNTLLLPYDTRVHDARSLNPYDSIMTNAEKLSRFGGGGTDTASALRVLNGLVGDRPRLVVILSDNQSWVGSSGVASYRYANYGHVPVAQEWANYKRKTEGAKLVAVNLQPYANTQVEDDDSVLNIGGWGDACWRVIKAFVDGDDDKFVEAVTSVEL